MTDDGRDLRDEGMARADRDPAWAAVADRTIIELARAGRPFTAEDLTSAIGRPMADNAVGARISAAKRRGLIVEVGYRQAERAERHASRMLVWVGTSSAGTAVPPIPAVQPPPRPRLAFGDLVPCHRCRGRGGRCLRCEGRGYINP